MSKGWMAASAATMFIALSFAGLVAAQAFPLRGDEGGAHTRAAKKQGKIYNLAAQKAPAKILKKVDPVYPKKLDKRKKGGTVVLRVVIGTTGHIEALKVLKSDDPLFSKAAKQAVSQWVYEPVKVDGKVVRAENFISIRFLPSQDKKPKQGSEKAPAKPGKTS